MRQPVPNRSASTSQPARIGPPTAARPIIGPKVPKALPISVGGNIVLDHARPCGIITAPKRALQHAQRDEHVRRRRQRAQPPSRHEAGDADQEHPAPAEDVAEPAAGDHDRRRPACSRRRPLHAANAGAALTKPQHACDIARESSAMLYRRHVAVLLVSAPAFAAWIGQPLAGAPLADGFRSTIAAGHRSFNWLQRTLTFGL